MTILLYVSGLSMNAIAQLFNVSAQAVLNWVWLRHALLSDHRHWFARFRRKSKVVSKSKEMIELTLTLFAKLRVNGTINSMRDSMLALLT